jgi:hypothetical protein
LAISRSRLMERSALPSIEDSPRQIPINTARVSRLFDLGRARHAVSA